MVLVVSREVWLRLICALMVLICVCFIVIFVAAVSRFCCEIVFVCVRRCWREYVIRVSFSFVFVCCRCVRSFISVVSIFLIWFLVCLGLIIFKSWFFFILSLIVIDRVFNWSLICAFILILRSAFSFSVVSTFCCKLSGRIISVW